MGWRSEGALGMETPDDCVQPGSSTPVLDLGRAGLARESSVAAEDAVEDVGDSEDGERWICAYCTSENFFSAAAQESGGVASCSCCLKLKEGSGWQCEECTYVMTRGSVCTMCGTAPFGGNKTKSRGDQDIIMRDYKTKKRRSANARRQSTPAPCSSQDDFEKEPPDSKAVLQRNKRSRSEPCVPPPVASPVSPVSDTRLPAEAIREEQSKLFKGQLQVMHQLVRHLEQLGLKGVDVEYS